MIKLDLNSLKSNPNFLVVDSLKVVKKFLTYSKLEPVELHIADEVSLDGLDNFPTVKRYKSSDISSIPGVNYHKGVIGVFKKPNFQNPQLEAPFVVLNGVSSPENVGSIVRTLAGLNFKTLVIDKKTVNPYVRRAIRVSVGNIVFINVLETEDLSSFIRNCDLPIYASGNEAGSISFLDWMPEEKSGFMIGSEGHGIDKELYQLCKETIKIPVADEVQHFNAGHSCAILASKYLFNTTK